MKLIPSSNVQEKTSLATTSEKLMKAEEDRFLYFKIGDILMTDLYDWKNGYVRSDSSPKVASKRKHVSLMGDAPGGGCKAKTGRVVKVNEEDIALFRFGEEVLAVKERCPHQGGPLHLGDIEVLPDQSLCVRCPWHNWCMDLTTGNVRRPRGKEISTNVFPTKVDKDNSIYVGFPHFSSRYFQAKEVF